MYNTTKTMVWPNKRGYKTTTANSEKIGKRQDKIRSCVDKYAQRTFQAYADNNNYKFI